MLDERKWSPGGLEFQKMVIPRYFVFVYLRNLRFLASGNGGAWRLFLSRLNLSANGCASCPFSRMLVRAIAKPSPANREPCHQVKIHPCSP
jgi:hypothetical protein